MPTATVLYLRALHDGVLYGATGQHAAGFWHDWWRHTTPGVGDALHDNRPLRQFTVSPLLGPANARRGATPVAAGDEARLRLTTLDDREQAGLPAEATIGGVGWQFEGAVLASAEHPGRAWLPMPCCATAIAASRLAAGDLPDGGGWLSSRRRPSTCRTAR